MTPAIAPASIRSLRSPGGRAAQGPPLLSAVAIPLPARAAATAAVAATPAAPVVAARPVLLDVDLHLVVGLEAADRLAALADDEADLLLCDLDRRDAGSVGGQLRARLRDHLEHLVEDEVARPLRLLERVTHDLLRDAGDLDVHLKRGDAVAGPGDLEVHVAEVVLRALDVGQDHVVVAFHDETHRDAAHRCLDRHTG